MHRLLRILLPAWLLATASWLHADLRLSEFAYPFPVEIHTFEDQKQSLEMAYMDVRPNDGEPVGTVLLLHGKNFSGAYWEATAKALREGGYRVIMPDQVGFGKSTKPGFYHYTFHQLAENTRDLLEALDVEKAHVLGHSMGGMLATRFALMYPDATQSLTLLNPIGLEDWKALGVPYAGVEQWYRSELEKTPEKIRAYMRESYYDGEWDSAYDPWVEMLAEFIESPDYARMAWNQALTYDMIFTQPVLYEFGRLSMPTLLIIGQRDRTALGKDQVSADVRDSLGRYPKLGGRTARAIPDATLVELEGVGHLPHIEAFPRFEEAFTAFIGSEN